jgi:alpha-beta hydrolase superfamily lysophospholipase
MSTEVVRLLTEVNRSRSAAAGLDIFLYDHLTNGVSSFDEWRSRFGEKAHWFADRGAEAIARGLGATAREAFETATLCFHYATCVPGSNREEVIQFLQHAAEAHRAAVSAATRAFVRFAPEDTGGAFCGILERPAVDEAVPVVIIVPGLDSSKEEFDHIAGKIRERGLATLRIDGPGQGEMLSRGGPVADYERVVAAAIDALATQPGLDINRIGAIGLSLGGYYVPRSLAYEPRLRAAVAVTGPYSFPAWSSMPAMLCEILTLRCGGEREAKAFVENVDLSRVAARIGQPLLVLAGKADPVVPAEDARRLAREARHAELVELPEGDHLGANRRWEWEARIADWLVEHL